MARSLKTRGKTELDLLRARVERQWAYRRINRKDRDYIINRLDQIEARIVEMRELNERGEEEG